MRSGLLANLNTACGSSVRRIVGGQDHMLKSSVGVSRIQPVIRHLEASILSPHNCSSWSGAALAYSCKVNYYSVDRAPVRGIRRQRKPMAASGSQAVPADMHVNSLTTSCSSIADIGRPTHVFFLGRRLWNCRMAAMSLRVKEPSGVFHFDGFEIRKKSCNSSLFIGNRSRDFHVSCSLYNYVRAASDVPIDAAPAHELHGSTVDSSEQKTSDERPLKLLSGSCYFPHPDKEATGGEDAHFIYEDKQVIGVADGVGGWADVNVDAGEYARRLMSNSVNAIKEESIGSIDLLKVLEKAHSITSVQGSSTVCIVALTNKGVHAINLGDSGFLIIREGSIIFRSPAQQYGFNFPYQLQYGTEADLPSSGQVFTVPVAPGDVIVAGTDGLFDNLYNNEISSIVVGSSRARLGPQVTAEKIASLARERALDKHKQTPFASAAQEAGFRYHGGKLDDITVVVSYVTDMSKL